MTRKYAIRFIGSADVSADDVWFNVRIIVDAEHENEAIEKARESGLLEETIIRNIADYQYHIDESIVNTTAVVLGEDYLMNQAGAPRLFEDEEEKK